MSQVKFLDDFTDLENVFEPLVIPGKFPLKILVIIPLDKDESVKGCGIQLVASHVLPIRSEAYGIGCRYAVELLVTGDFFIRTACGKLPSISSNRNSPPFS